MSNYSLEQACRDFSALAAMVRGDYDALRQANAIADQIRAARESRIRTLKEGGVLSDRRARLFSPGARSHQEISTGVDRAQAIPLKFDVDGLREVDRIYSNTGRRLMPEKWVDGYTADELRAEERDRLQITKKQQRRLDAEYELVLDAAEHGGQPTGAVVIHSEEWTEESGVLACPVPFGWSPHRVVRVLSLGSNACFWCGCRQNRRLDDHLLVSCGSILRVFPTCVECRQRFERDTEYSGLDWHILSDRWNRSVGYPSDEWY
ncbi:hypothetical protein [Prescottella agglutinans]|uniref:hypothetical protein n=1 Tax=Prescottella agglutinans TaxID=1644129 RepID=UPI003D99AC55